jgi:hypothetical protein
MAYGRRKEILEYIVTKLKTINGSTSPFDSSYTFNKNLNNDVYRQVKFIDEVNSFPAVYLQGLEEIRDYQTYEFTNAALPIIIRCYDKSGSPNEDLEKLIQDIEHVLDHLPTISPDNGITDILIDEITLDEGLINPYGIGEIFMTVFYVLEK